MYRCSYKLVRNIVGLPRCSCRITTLSFYKLFVSDYHVIVLQVVRVGLPRYRSTSCSCRITTLSFYKLFVSDYHVIVLQVVRVGLPRG